MSFHRQNAVDVRLISASDPGPTMSSSSRICRGVDIMANQNYWLVLLVRVVEWTCMKDLEVTTRILKFEVGKIVIEHMSAGAESWPRNICKYLVDLVRFAIYPAFRSKCVIS